MLGPMRQLALAALVLAGCGAEPTADADACIVDGRLEVGAGGARLTALPLRGGELPIVHGPQGGIHVVVGLWVRDLPLEMDVTYRLRDAADGSLVGTETTLHLTPGFFAVDGARYERHPDLVVLDGSSADVTPFAGRSVILRAEARTAAGTACDARAATLVDSP
jgi:hypothetical protein